MLFLNSAYANNEEDIERENYLKQFKGPIHEDGKVPNQKDGASTYHEELNDKLKLSVFNEYLRLAKVIGTQKKDVWDKVAVILNNANSGKQSIGKGWEHLLYSQAYLVELFKYAGWINLTFDRKRDEFINAFAEAKKAVSENPREPIFLAHFALVMFLRGEESIASIWLSKAMNLNGDHFLIYYVMAVIEFLKGNIVESTVGFTNALNFVSNNNSSSLEISLIEARYLQIKSVWNKDYLIELHHKKELKSLPNNILVLYRYALFLYEKKRYQESIFYLNRAKKELTPQNPYNKMTDILIEKVKQRLN